MNLKYFLTILLMGCLTMEKSFGVEDDSGSDSDGEGRGVIVLNNGGWEIGGLPPALSSESLPVSAAPVTAPTESFDIDKNVIVALVNRPELTEEIRRNYPLVARLLAKVDVYGLRDDRVMKNIRRNSFLTSLFIDDEAVEVATKKGKPFFLTQDNLFDDLLLLESYLESL